MCAAHLSHCPESIFANLFNGISPSDGTEFDTRVESLLGDDTQRVGDNDGGEPHAPLEGLLAHRAQRLRHGDVGELVVGGKGQTAYRIHVRRQRDGGDGAAVEAVVEDVGHPRRDVDVPHPGVVLEAAEDFHVGVQRHGGSRLVAGDQRVVARAVNHQAVHHIMAVAAGDAEVGELRAVGEGAEADARHRRGNDHVVDFRATVEGEVTDGDQPLGQRHRGGAAVEAKGLMADMPHIRRHVDSTGLRDGHHTERQAVLAV